MKGEGNSQDYGMRIYDPRLGKFLSVDPLTKGYPELTPYQFASNTPIQAIDLDGRERLDMTSVNATKRTATITIVKSVEVVKTGLVAEVSALVNTRFASRFPNTTLYTKSLPQNGQPIDFVTQKDYNSGIGYALDLQFSVSLGYVANSAAATTDAAHSTVTMGANSSNFTSNMTFAHASVTTANTAEINPAFDAFSTNNGISINEDYEELIAHEIGFHNMMGLSHTANAAGAIYPTTNTLESNLHNKIISTADNVKQMLRMNITTRQNLTGGLPVTPSTTPTNNTQAAPATIQPDDNSPDHMKIANYNGN